MIRGYSDHAANERTFLAWVRTGIAVIAFGFVIEKFNLFVLTTANANSPDAGRRLQLGRLSGPLGRYDGLTLLEGEVAVQFLAAVLSQDKVKPLLSSEHFTVDGTLLEAWASPKSFRPKDGSGEPPGPGRNGEQDFHGERRTNDTHVSTTDPDARLYRKGPGKEARLCFMGHALMDNRNGLIVGAVTTCASGHAARLATLALIEPHADRSQPITLGADKGYDTSDFVMELRDKAVTPHVAQNQS